ncbi:MAG: hypothetical protein WC829_11215 [Hyphomicrobium sp.]
MTSTPNNRWTDRLFDDLVIFGLLAVVCSIILAASATEYFGAVATASKLTEELARLPDAAGQPQNTRAVLSGVIADDGEPIFQNFVTYVEESYNGGGKFTSGSTWEHESSRKKTFRVKASGGEITLANAGYVFSPRTPWTNAPVLADWDHVEARIETPPGIFERARRFRGLVAGGPVTAVGTVTPNGTFDADYLVGSSFYDMQASLRSIASGRFASVLFWLMLLSGACLALTIGIFVRRRL